MEGSNCLKYERRHQTRKKKAQTKLDEPTAKAQDFIPLPIIRLQLLIPEPPYFFKELGTGEAGRR